MSSGTDVNLCVRYSSILSEGLAAEEKLYFILLAPCIDTFLHVWGKVSHIKPLLSDKVLVLDHITPVEVITCSVDVTQNRRS